MNLSRHCTLCENEITNLKKGLTCKLTSKKPDFKETCTEIILDKKFQRKLEDVNLKLEKILKTKNSEHLIFYFLIVIGFLLIISNSKLIEWAHDLYYWYYRVGIIGIGITILMRAYNNLNKFRNKLKVAEFDKNKIDAVLMKYGISYKSNFDFKEKIHGSQEIEVIIEYKNWTKTRTSTRY